MSIRGRNDDLLTLREIREREAATKAAISLILKNMEDNGETQAQRLRHIMEFDFRREGCSHTEGCIRRCPLDGLAYECFREPNQRVRSSVGAPSVAVGNWRKVGVVG